MCHLMVEGWSFGSGYPSFWGLEVGQGTSANFLVASLYTIASMDVAVGLVTGIWVEVVATMGSGAGAVGGGR